MRFYPLLFQPNLHSVIWGGNQLRPYKGLEPSNEPIGESWEVSAVPSAISIIANGEWEGKDLISVINEYPDEILGKEVNKKYHGQLPLLVKFIDAKKDLSIQVHPNDEMAQREHGKMGKSEMWYIIKAEEGSHLYAGFKEKITPYEYQKRIEDGTITEVLADLRSRLVMYSICLQAGFMPFVVVLCWPRCNNHQMLPIGSMIIIAPVLTVNRENCIQS